ncbi:hypothetical protein [Prevotella koreensis]|uniref:hypothetical protein n=1 Tax=Prevotella koreensis TaxID=2490854 RepID=UPI00131A2D47|nr:hypothetical protein [Prevotella koreensis]
MSGERWTINDERSIFALLGSARRRFQRKRRKDAQPSSFIAQPSSFTATAQHINEY